MFSHACADPTLCCEKINVRFNINCKTSEMLVRQSIRTSTASSTLLNNSQGWFFLFALSHRKRCETRASRNFLTIFFPCFVKKKDFTGVADTACRKSPFALNVSDVTFSSAWV